MFLCLFQASKPHSGQLSSPPFPERSFSASSYHTLPLFSFNFPLSPQLAFPFYFSIFSPTSTANSTHMLRPLKMTPPPQNLVSEFLLLYPIGPSTSLTGWLPEIPNLVCPKVNSQFPPEPFNPGSSIAVNDTTVLSAAHPTHRGARLGFPSLYPTSHPLASPVILLPKFTSSLAAWSPGHALPHLGSCSSCLTRLPISMAPPSASVDCIIHHPNRVTFHYKKGH